jgi:hypothetical protein
VSLPSAVQSATAACCSIARWVVASVEEHVFPHEMRGRYRLFDIAELEIDELVKVLPVAILVDARLGHADRVLR